MEGEFDTTTPILTPTPARLGVLAFSHPVVQEDQVLVTPLPFPHVQVFTPNSLLKGFSWQVWGLILLSIGIFGLVNAISTSVGSFSIKKSCNSFLEVLLQGLSVFNGRDMAYQKRNQDNRSISTIFFYVWGIGCIVMTGMYSSAAVANALNAKLDLPFNSLSTFTQCVQRGHCQLVDRDLSRSWYEQIFGATKGEFLNLRKALEVHPVKIADNVTHALFHWDAVRPANFMSELAFIGLRERAPLCSFAEFLVHNEITLNYPFKKGSQLGLVLDRAIGVLQETGILSKLQGKYFDQSKDMQETCKDIGMHSTSIPLRAIWGATLFLLGGGIFGCLSLFMERLSLTSKYTPEKELGEGHGKIVDPNWQMARPRPPMAVIGRREIPLQQRFIWHD